MKKMSHTNYTLLEAFEETLDKIKKSLESGNYSKAKEYSSDLISASYLMKDKYTLFISEFLYKVFFDLEEIRDLHVRISRAMPTRLIALRMSKLSEEEVEEAKKDLRDLEAAYDHLRSGIVRFLKDVNSMEARYRLIDVMADFRFKANELIEKYK